MALVAYSDSEASDSEPETTTTTTTATVSKPQPQSQPPKPTTTTSSSSSFPTLVDRSNPRKIRIALDLKPESSSTSTPGNDDTAPRKKPKLGGGAFSGFNALLPAPKKQTTSGSGNGAGEKKAPPRKIFSLKTGATPGFDREADAEMRSEQAFGMLGKDGDAEDGDGDETIPKAGSLRGEEFEEESKGEGSELKMKPEGEVKLKGNPMMFKPLSVGRASQQKKRKVAALLASSSSSSASSSVENKSKKEEQSQTAPVQAAAPTPAPAPKPKISLFSLSSTDDTPSTTTTQSQSTSSTYEPLVYTPTTSALPAGPSPDPSLTPDTSSTTTTTTNTTQTLTTIANDLNLSKAQRRQLFGRHADTSATSRVLHFNTDREYAANQEMLHSTDLAAQQHNPVRSIAPGKHSLQQLVNAASSQREALEESFAAGRRNKKEAGSKYGW
ncbi:PRCC domain-containing protein [Aspergillus ibericus CBS 121593]|uniref:Mitotic checkpoint regulator, MAD2B-interacting-domain-containing protein n=1 Tax=Aspergillus ibericus CBS 121593 TaxID=1448316 RepID=A0A395GR51_9EURO|nr:hypothetical protein BO80DRAFT_428384 [Aspergillus ibericus CBS 121593]RAK97207.1 hypothetical protein BO80DRAFT_428384 [Aspergillus ibericus CBS 121593]